MGELEKRKKAILEVHEVNHKNMCGHPEYNHLWDLEQGFNILYGEMRKDFPLNQEILGIATKNHEKGDTVEMRSITIEDENRLMKEWKDKWLGEDEQ